MSPDLATPLTAALESAARLAGLEVFSSQEGASTSGQPTAVFILGLPGGRTEHTLRLELGDALDIKRPELVPALASHLREEAQRLRNPRPDAYVTLGGIPIAMSEFAWPFHRSVSGADSYIVHGLVTLADGAASSLYAKISASMTITFAEIVEAPEQPYAESFIYNAIRKTLDQGQLEMLKSGNRQPVPVTTRYYSRWAKKFIFTDTTDEVRRRFIMSKVFWLSGILGASKPVWIADPRDAQYLNTTAEALAGIAAGLVAEGLMAGSGEGEFAAAVPALMEREAEFRARLNESLAFTKPTFNEEMRAGHTNM